MSPLFVHWNVDPVCFGIGSLEIRWYGLLWVAALLAGMILFDRFVKREKLPQKTFDSIFWYVVVSLIAGARLGHCFFYEPAYYWARPVEILYIRDGGLASHGAAVGLLIGLWLFSRRCKLPYIWSLDRIGIAVAVGGALVRIGNLMNSEIYGGPTDLPWGFIFMRDGQTVPMHPTQIYEALAYLALFGLLWWLYFKKDMARKRPGGLFGIFLIWLFAALFLIEFIKNPQVAFEADMTLNMGQWLSLPFIAAGVAILVAALRKPKKKIS